MIFEGILRIDLHQLAPDTPGFLDFAEMAKGRCQDGAGKICPGCHQDALPQQCRGGLIFAGEEVGHR